MDEHEEFDKWFKENVAINDKGQHFPISKFELKMAFRAGFWKGKED